MTAVTALALGLLGRRRRSLQSDGAGPTIGERAAGAGTSASGKVLGVAAGVSRMGTDVVAGTLEVAGIAAATMVRAVGRLTDNISVSGLNLAAGTAARAGGLVLDGVAAVTEGVGGSLHRGSTAD